MNSNQSNDDSYSKGYTDGFRDGEINAAKNMSILADGVFLTTRLIDYLDSILIKEDKIK